MIEQQINLYQDRFREQRLWLSARDSLVLLALLILLLAAAGFFYQQRLEEMRAEQRVAQQQQQQATAALQKTRNQLEKLLANNHFEQTIRQASDAISVRKRLLNFVEHNRFGQGEGFSGYLASLSNIEAADIWLNEIALSQSDIRLAGSALKAEKIPGYFSRVKQQRIFEGRRFDVFEVQRDPKRDWKIDFRIASRESVDE